MRHLTCAAHWNRRESGQQRMGTHWNPARGTREPTATRPRAHGTHPDAHHPAGPPLSPADAAITVIGGLGVELPQAAAELATTPRRQRLGQRALGDLQACNGAASAQAAMARGEAITGRGPSPVFRCHEVCSVVRRWRSNRAPNGENPLR